MVGDAPLEITLIDKQIPDRKMTLKIIERPIKMTKRHMKVVCRGASASRLSLCNANLENQQHATWRLHQIPGQWNALASAGVMLGQRLWRWPNITPALSRGVRRGPLCGSRIGSGTSFSGWRRVLLPIALGGRDFPSNWWLPWRHCFLVGATYNILYLDCCMCATNILSSSCIKQLCC